MAFSVCLSGWTLIIINSHQDPLASLKVGAGLGAGQVWGPLVMFLNTPATDMSLMDAQTALTVARRGHFTMSSLHMLDQVNTFII